MKYPLDQLTFNDTVTHLVSHSNMQTVLIDKLTALLSGAMDASEHDDDEWYVEAKTLVEDLHSLKMWHESRRFSEASYQGQVDGGVYKAPPRNIVPTRSKVVKHLADPEPDQVGTVERLNDRGVQFDLEMDLIANKAEREFGSEMTEEDLANHFDQKREKKKKEEPKTLNKMSLEEIKSWEKNQDNATDIYKIAARVKNLARGANASLTPQGDILCNTYTHVMKSFYDFAEKIDDTTIKINLIKLIRTQESMPGTVIAAAGAGVTKEKDKNE